MIIIPKRLFTKHVSLARKIVILANILITGLNYCPYAANYVSVLTGSSTKLLISVTND